MFFREGSTGDGKDIGPELSLVSPKHNTSNHVSLRHGLIPDQLLRSTQPWVDGGGAEGDGGRGPLRGNLGCVLAKRTENGCWGEVRASKMVSHRELLPGPGSGTFGPSGEKLCVSSLGSTRSISCGR